MKVCALTVSASLMLMLGGCDIAKSSNQAAKTTKPTVAATVNGVNISEKQVESIFKQGGAAEMSNDPELRARVIDQLAVQLIASKEAAKKGLDKDPEVKEQLDMARQTILTTAFIKDYLKKNPVSDADVKSEYEKAKAAMGGEEYKARHILVKDEAEVKSIIAKLKKNPKLFEALAKERSLDPGSKTNGGDLGWFDPHAMVPEFSDALSKLQKGQFTQDPVKSEFGYHVILLEDTREKQFPPLEAVQAKLEQQLQQKKLAQFLADMKAGAKISVAKLAEENKKAPAPEAK